MQVMLRDDSMYSNENSIMILNRATLTWIKLIMLNARIKNPGVLLALTGSPYMVASISQNKAPMVGPMTNPRTAQVVSVDMYSTLTDGATAADRYAVEHKRTFSFKEWKIYGHG